MWSVTGYHSLVLLLSLLPSLAEEELRFGQFKENLAKIEKHNSEGHSWRLGVTKFADLSKY